MFKPWPKNRKRNKFGATRTPDGFPSKLEAAVYQLLLLRERMGEIKNISRQPSVKLTRAAIGYKPDFKYIDCKTGETVHVEAKGQETEGYSIRKRLWKYYGPGRLEIYKGHYRRPGLQEVVVPVGDKDETPNSDNDC